MSDAIRRFLQQAPKELSDGRMFIKSNRDGSTLILRDNEMVVLHNSKKECVDYSTDPVLINMFNSLFCNTTVSKMEIDGRVKSVLDEIEKMRQIKLNTEFRQGVDFGLENAISIIKKHFGEI